MNEHATALHLGINAISLLSPLTGVGQYTFNLNLTRELQKIPGLSVYYFYGPFGSERCYLDEQQVQQVSRHLASRNTVYRAGLDGKALARAVCRLLAAPQEAAQRGRQAATRVRQVFSRDRFLQDTLAVYREVAAARGGR